MMRPVGCLTRPVGSVTRPLSHITPSSGAVAGESAREGRGAVSGEEPARVAGSNVNVSRVVDSGLLATRAGNLHGWQRIMSERGVRCGGKREREERLYLSLSLAGRRETLR